MKIKRIVAFIFISVAILMGLSIPLSSMGGNASDGGWNGLSLSAGTLDENSEKTELEASTYSDSPLATYTNVTSNKSTRTQPIEIITIHCMVAQWTGQYCADYFASTTRQASSNYCVGVNGDIAISVPEAYRSWCSDSNANDQRAITIEVASDTVHPYTVTDAAYNALINLLVDICQRNPALNSGLRWKNDPSYCAVGANGIVPSVQNMTVHRWYAAKACPGDYLMGKHAEIADTVNARLAGISEGAEPDLAVTDANIRLEDSALRFGVAVKKSYYEEFGSSSEVGLLAIPSSMAGDELTINTTNVLKMVKGAHIDGWGYMLFNGAITNFPKSAYSTELSVRVYIKSGNNVEYSETFKCSFIGVVNDAISNASTTRTIRHRYQVSINGVTKWSPYTQAQINKLLTYV